MLKEGIKGTEELTVTEELTAAAMGSGELKVFATPAMVALVEKAAWRSVAAELEGDQGTVGIQMELEHVAPTPVGAKVRCETTLTQVDGRKLTFGFEVYDECSLIGKGTHQRFIIKNEKFQQKADSRHKG